jgi:hypothetical protein
VNVRAERPSDRWLRAGYAGLLGFFALERRLRPPGSASSLRATEDDQGTTRLIVAAYALAVELPMVTRRLRFGRLGPRSATAGLLGSLLTWTGFDLTSRSLPTVAAVSGLVGAA